MKQKKKDEIKWNLINSTLAGGLVFFGSLTNGFSFNGILIALAASMIVAITKFKDYWTKEEKEYTSTKGLFNFI